MSQPLDNLILVGITQPDEETPQGAAAYRNLMDAANVMKKGIKFFGLEDTPKEILLKSFIPDKSQKHGLLIGNSMFIISEDVSQSTRHQFKNLGKKVDTVVKTGMSPVNLEEMSEPEISEWLETGSYTPKNNPEENNNTADLLGLSLIHI